MSGLVSFNARIDKGDLRELSRRLGGVQKKIDAALKRPLNRVADKAKSLMASEIMKEINIKRKDLLGSGKKKSRSALITKSGIVNNTITVTLPKTSRPQLIFFGAKQTARGVTYRIKKGGKRGFIKSAFIITSNKTTFVTKRSGEPKRFSTRSNQMISPVVGPLRGASPWAVYLKNNLGKKIKILLAYTLRKEVRAAINNVIRKQGGK
jgi:hypothetical protein